MILWTAPSSPRCSQAHRVMHVPGFSGHSTVANARASQRQGTPTNQGVAGLDPALTRPSPASSAH